MAAARFTDPIEPMDLANMRQNGVRSLDVSCSLCRRRAILSADPWPDHVPVPSFGSRMVWTRPHHLPYRFWHERKRHGA
jgi:hypothetical protein